jgi:hypothetical protein
MEFLHAMVPSTANDDKVPFIYIEAPVLNLVNCFPESLQLLANGSVTYPQVATEFNLWEAPRVFAELAKNPGAVHKGVLVREV